MEVLTTKVKITGVYGWGIGYYSETIKKKWDNFWRNSKVVKESTFWKYVDLKGHGEYLVSFGGSIFLHPMGFDILLNKMGETYGYENGKKVIYHLDIDNIKEIMDECCRVTGGSYTIEPVTINEI